MIGWFADGWLGQGCWYLESLVVRWISKPSLPGDRCIVVSFFFPIRCKMPTNRGIFCEGTYDVPISPKIIYFFSKKGVKYGPFRYQVVKTTHLLVLVVPHIYIHATSQP